ncbi:MAG: TonB family protein [Bacteroidia bacterium]|jgi:TonB family protein|nr:TonB family protein [Bacteroidia bacterium]
MNLRRLTLFVFAFLLSTALAFADGGKKNGKVKTTHANGVKASQGKVKNYQKQGSWKYWNEKGILVKLASYKNDTLDGVFISYFETGQSETVGKYLNGKKVGEWVKFYQNGELSQYAYFVNGTLHGTQKHWFENGKLQMEAVYENGVLISRKTWYNSGRRFRVEQYKNGKADGVWVMYEDIAADTFPKLVETYSNDMLNGISYKYSFGKVINERSYLNGKLHGTWKSWNTSGTQTEQKNYKDGQLHGECIFWWNGIMQKSENYLNGTKNGRFAQYNREGLLLNYTWYTSDRKDSIHEFHKNGKIARRVKIENVIDNIDNTSFKNVVLDEAFTENGNLYYRTSYVDDIKSGLWTRYYRSGVKKYEIEYIQGDAQGKCRFWYENGKPMLEADCDRGKVMKEPKVMSETGKVLKSNTKEYYEIVKKCELSKLVNYNPASFVPLQNTALANQMKQAINDAYNESPIIENVIPKTEVINASDSAQIFQNPDVMPEFPGGEKALNKFITETIRYPFMEREAGKQGTVYIKFTVKSDGSITDIRPAKEVAGAPGFTREAMRVVRAMPQWIPGEFNGRAVSCDVSVPIRFVLR